MTELTPEEQRCCDCYANSQHTPKCLLYRSMVATGSLKEGDRCSVIEMIARDELCFQYTRRDRLYFPNIAEKLEEARKENPEAALNS
jgi:hypothetical protein